MKKQFALIVTIAVLAATFAAPAAYACSNPPPPQNPPQVVVELHEVCVPLDDPTHCMIRAWVKLLNYSTTFGSGANTFCACALNKIGAIKEILYARMCDSATGERINGFAFDTSANVTAAVNGLLNGDYGGFQAAILGTGVQPGTLIDLKFDVLLNPGWVSAAQVASAIENSAGSVVTAESNANGALINHIGTFPEVPCEQTGTCNCSKIGNNMAFLNGAEEELIRRGDLDPDEAVEQMEPCKQPLIGAPVADRDSVSD